MFNWLRQNMAEKALFHRFRDKFKSGKQAKGFDPFWG
jgi:hypothetical protein